MSSLNRPTLERLLLYYHFINAHLDQQESAAVSSAVIAKFMDSDDTQVRKDLAAIGLKGRPRIGFIATEVKSKIREILGFDDNFKAVVIGAGRLGGAIASYKEFSDYGLEIVALFDNDLNKIGLTMGNHVVQPLNRLQAIIKKRQVKLGILTVPAEAAQEVTERLIKSGVNTIWNFSPANITITGGGAVRHEHIAVGLAELLYHLKKTNRAQNQINQNS